MFSIKNIKFSQPILCLLPSLVLIPVSINIVKDIHLDGLSIIYNFIAASIQPSTDYNVISNSLNQIQITIAVALFSWSISIFLGFFLSLASSYNIYKLLGIPKLIAVFIRRTLALLRSIHELIWGIIFLQIFGLAPWIAILSIIIPYSSLLARIFSEQIDSIDLSKIIAIQKTGAKNIQVLITFLIPKIMPLISSYGFYRLECAIRGATLLGVFGLGGIGTELQLATSSLNFNEMWTSIWLLFIVIFILEQIVHILQQPSLIKNKTGQFSIGIILLLLCTCGLSLVWLKYIGIDFSFPETIHLVQIPSIVNILLALKNLSWIKLFSDTLLITIIASLLATGIPPLLLLISHNKIVEIFLSVIWTLCRLFPPPLTSLLILLFSKPSLYVAALALGIQNIGVLGRLLKESIGKQNNKLYNVLKANGSNPKISWLYGKFAPQSNTYLIYSIYRADIILRETVVVGVVGGVGLGWQLQESLSSFAWEEVFLITLAFITITLMGEYIGEILQKQIQHTNKDK